MNLHGSETSPSIYRNVIKTTGCSHIPGHVWPVWVCQAHLDLPRIHGGSSETVCRCCKATKFSYLLLVLWGLLSAIINGTYAQLLSNTTVLSGWDCEIVSRSSPRDIASSISPFWIIPIIIATGIELSFCSGWARTAAMKPHSGPAGNLNLTLPRLMGSMGEILFGYDAGCTWMAVWVEKQKERQ